ncbi:MAG: hypothetical protein JSV23_02290 [Promethearchaeota archaeon]|nr:MAG: hypothetical protein JSV23_02290 [Candidatus Lokiarchaeota archaeon]
MGKGGAILGILGLILGAGGLGLGIVNWVNQPYELHWYSYRDLEFTPSPATVYIPIQNMSIVFQLGTPMSLHLLFICSARCLGDLGSFSDLFFYFMINDVRQIDMPWARVGSFESNTNYEYYSVSLQHYIDLVPPGVYNFTVAVMTERVGNFIRESSFWIHAYTP